MTIRDLKAGDAGWTCAAALCADERGLCLDGTATLQNAPDDAHPLRVAAGADGEMRTVDRSHCRDVEPSDLDQGAECADRIAARDDTPAPE
jgi:hypothetical protein